MITKRRNQMRRKARFSRQGALLGLGLLLIVSFFLLDFLYKWKGNGDKGVEITEIEIAEVEKKEEEGIQTESEETEIVIEKILAELKEEETEEINKEESVVLPPRIAIIIDDLGYSWRTVQPIFDIGYPLTLSILPGLRYSLPLAEKGSQAPFEATLHLPLEPEIKGPLERGTILVTMSEEEVRDLIEKHIAPLLSSIRGVNGHMGSKATADEKLMRIVLEEVKKRGLYFVDSYTTEKSVALEVAESLGMRTASRQVFLDSGREKDNADYIRGQVEELAELARKEGKAVGIGHPRTITLKVLREMMPKLASQGILFVTASEIVE